MSVGQPVARRLASIVALALAVTTCEATLASSADAVVSAAAQARVDSRPDAVSAMSSARAQGTRVENLAARTPTTSTYANKNGTWTTEAYAGVVRSKMDDDTWVDVDPSLESTSKAFEPTAVPFDATFSDGGDKALATVTSPGGAKLDVAWPTVLPTGAAKGDELRFEDAALGGGQPGDLVVTSLPDGFNFSVVLYEAPAADAEPLSYRVPLSVSDGRIVTSDDGSLTVKSKGATVASMTPPVMWDSAADNPVQVPVTSSFEGAGAAVTMVLKPDMDWLRDPNRTYPVTVDPTLVLTATGDTWVDSASGSSQSSSPELRVGSSDAGTTKARSYLNFDISSLTSKATATVTSASLSLSNFATGACTGSAVRLSRVTSAWTVPGVTWAAQPTTVPDGSSTTTASFGTTGCVTESPVAFDATAIVQAWKAGSTNNGLQLKADDEVGAAGFRKYRSLENGDSSKVATLSVTYNTPPEVPTYTMVTPAGSVGTTAKTRSTTPTFATTPADADGGNVTAELRIRQGTNVVQSWTSGGVVAGAQVSHAITTALAAGSYTASWRAADGLATSAWSADQAFDVDLTPPTNPSMSCSNYPNNSWAATRPAVSTTCTVTVASDVALVQVWDGHEWISLPPPTNNTTSFNRSIEVDDTEAFYVVSADAAGNWATTNYYFGVGDGGFYTPTAGARFADVLPVNAGAPAGATLAVVKWREAGTSNWTTATEVTKGGSVWNGTVESGGSVARTGDLLWDAEVETGLSAPANLEIEACFTYNTAPAERCGKVRAVTLVDHAFGGTYATTTVGPADVALLTGEYQTSATDAAVPGYRTSLSIGRTFQSLGSGALTPAESVFGPGWVANLQGPEFGFAAGQVQDTTADDGAITLLDSDGAASVYKLGGPAAQAVGVYAAQGAVVAQNAKLEIKTGTPKTLQLTEADGTITVWNHSGSGVWKVASVTDTSSAPGISYGYSGPNSEFVSGIYSGPPGVACNATSQARGCRALQLTYAGTGTSTRLSQVDLKTWDPKPGTDGAPTASAGMVTVPVAKYSYDGSNRLTGVWDPRLDYNSGSSHVTTAYGYSTIGGRAHLSSITPPGEKTWNFTLDQTSGKFLGATRAQDAAVGGTATWAVKYSVPLSGTGLPDVTSDATKTWGQSTNPANAVAVFGPDAPGTSDYTYADLTYFTAGGTVTNTASYGAGEWLVDSVEFDNNGNTTWSLSAAARSDGLAHNLSANQLRWNSGTVNVYSADGTRIEQSYAPFDWTVRKDRTSLMARHRVDYLYDDEATAAEMPGKPSTWTAGDNPKRNVLIKTTSTIADTVNATFDPQTTWYRYQPVVAGDGDGWTLGQPTRVSTTLGSGWSTTLTRFDTEGKTIETRTPQGVAAVDGAGSDARSRLTRYYTADGSSPLAGCRNKPEWNDAVCSVGPAAGSAPTTAAEGFDYLGNPTRAVETAGTTQRISVTTRDAAGRPTKDALTSSNAPAGQVPVPDRTYTYEPTTGAAKAITANGQTVSITVDTWGRGLTHSDGNGNTATSTYDNAGRLATLNDGKGLYTYTWDGTDANGKTERRGLLTKVDAGLPSGPDVFTTGADAAGNQTKIVYPNGVTRASSFNTTGAEVTRLYENSAGTDLLGWNMYRDVEGRDRLDVNTSGYQWYDYDDRGRLTKVEDGFSYQCATRVYDFSLDSNRNSLTSYAPGTNGACQTSTPASAVAGSFDGDDKKTDTGYVYDSLGRTTTLPAADAVDPANGNVSATYYANDLVASLSRPNAAGGAQVKTWGLDALGRLATMSSSVGGVELRKTTNHYADGGDAPSWVSTDARPNAQTAWGTTWTRNILGVDGGLGLLQNSDGTSKIQLASPHGDSVATMANTTGASSLETYSESTEYGLVRPQTPSNGGQYGWLGARMRSNDALAGIVLMGVRLYNPATGRFMTGDPIYGGNDNLYNYPADPVNHLDLSGRAMVRTSWGAYKRYINDVALDYVKVWINKRTFRLILSKVERGLAWADALGAGIEIFGKKVNIKYGKAVSKALAVGTLTVFGLEFAYRHGRSLAFMVWSSGTIWPYLSKFAYEL